MLARSMMQRSRHQQYTLMRQRLFSTSGGDGGGDNKRSNPYDRGASRFRPQQQQSTTGSTGNAATKSEPFFVKRSALEKKLY